MLMLRKKDVIVALLFLSLYVIYYLFISYVDKQEQFYKLSNGLYSKHHLILIDKDNHDWVKTELSPTSYRLFIEYNPTYRFFISHRDNWSPPLVAGRFFTSKEEKPVAVVGREMITYNKSRSGSTKYVLFQGERYEVIGILGAPFASSADYLIMLSRPGQVPVSANKRIVVDSDRKATINEISQRVTDTFSHVTQIETSQRGLSRTGNIPFLYQLLIIQFYLLLFLSALACIRYWYESEKKLLHILFLIGIPKRKMMVQLLYKVFLFITFPGMIMIAGMSMLGFGIFIKQMLALVLLFQISCWGFLYLFFRAPASLKGGVISL